MTATAFFAASTGLEFGQARKLLGISLRAMAGEIGVSPTTLQRWEASSRPLTEMRLTNWADALQRAEMARTASVHRATSGRRRARRVKQEA
jgi:transcriptional regulator with XRE-family HTH domain